MASLCLWMFYNWIFLEWLIYQKNHARKGE